MSDRTCQRTVSVSLEIGQAGQVGKNYTLSDADAGLLVAFVEA